MNKKGIFILKSQKVQLIRKRMKWIFFDMEKVSSNLYTSENVQQYKNYYFNNFDQLKLVRWNCHHRYGFYSNESAWHIFQDRFAILS